MLIYAQGGKECPPSGLDTTMQENLRKINTNTTGTEHTPLGGLGAQPLGCVLVVFLLIFIRFSSISGSSPGGVLLISEGGTFIRSFSLV